MSNSAVGWTHVSTRSAVKLQRTSTRFGCSENLDLQTIDEIEHVQVFTGLSWLI